MSHKLLSVQNTNTLLDLYFLYLTAEQYLTYGGPHEIWCIYRYI